MKVKISLIKEYIWLLHFFAKALTGINMHAFVQQVIHNLSFKFSIVLLKSDTRNNLKNICINELGVLKIISERSRCQQSISSTYRRRAT